MIDRKWAALGCALTAVVLVAGLSVADDESDSPLLKLMKQVNIENATIQKGVRSAANFKKSQAEVAKASEKLVKLLKDAKPLGKEAVEGPHNEKKATTADWDKLMDDCIKKTADYATLTGDSAADQKKAKDEFNNKVTKSCTACHDVFRVEE